MEIVGGFMVMMSILTLFLAVVWLIMPFVVFAIKGKQDRTLEILESIEKRLAALESNPQPNGPLMDQACPAENCDSSAESLHNDPAEKTVTPTESAVGKNGSDESTVV